MATLKHYRFIMPNGVKPTFSTWVTEHQEYIETELASHPLSPNSKGRLVIMDVDRFNEVMANLPDQSEEFRNLIP